jgi:hypothetical protein
MLTIAQKMSWAGLAIRIRLHFDYIHIVLEHNIDLPLTKLVKHSDDENSTNTECHANYPLCNIWLLCLYIWYYIHLWRSYP